MSNQLILSIFIPATNNDSNDAVIYNIEHNVNNRTYYVTETEGDVTNTFAFNSAYDAYEFVSGSVHYTAIIGK